MNKHECSICGLIDGPVKKIVRDNLYEYCGGCDAFIRFIYEPPSDFVLTFGKYAGYSISRLRTIPDGKSYLVWMYENCTGFSNAQLAIIADAIDIEHDYLEIPEFKSRKQMYPLIPTRKV